jgi:O-antigen ligase
MKKLIFIKDTLSNKISYHLLAWFLIALPFDHFYSEIILSCFTIHTLIHLRKVRLGALQNKPAWIISAIFFFNLIAISYSNYRAEGLKDLTHQFGILLFPVCLSVTNMDLNKYKFILLEIFAITITCTILYLYIDAFRIIFYYHLPYYSIINQTFINQNFSAPIGLHATYLSMFATMSTSICLYLFFQESGLAKWKYIFFSFILFAGLIQLSSRSVFISMFIIVIITTPVLLSHHRKKWQFSLLSLLIFVCITLTITKVNSLQKRYINDLERDLSANAINADLSETRMKRWDLQLELIQKSPFIGYGSGAEINILKDKYFEKKFYRSYLLELNAHNQYLSFLLNTGIIGLLIYLCILGYGFLLAIKNKDFLLLSFLILIAIVSISENLLDLNKGIFFYSFFYSLFLLTSFPKNKIVLE